MDEMILVRLGLAAAESIEAAGATRAAGVVRQLARRVAEMARVDAAGPSADRCASCGDEIRQPATGRRRRYCEKRRCGGVGRAKICGICGEDLPVGARPLLPEPLRPSRPGRRYQSRMATA